jgi:hypothetical protein
MVLLDKYQFYRPTHRLLEDLQTYGLDLAAETLTDGLKRFPPLLEPIYAAIIAESRRGVLWSADETRWMVFVQIEQKADYRWYLWAFQSATAIAFELDPSRSHRVPDGHFQGVEGGILLVDRYSGYKAMELVKDGTIRLAFCWAHVRRDFLGVGKSWPKLAAWALEWLRDIREWYHLKWNQSTAMADGLLGGLRGGRRQGSSERRGLPAVEHVRGVQCGDVRPLSRRIGSPRLLVTGCRHWLALTPATRTSSRWTCSPLDTGASQSSARRPTLRPVGNSVKKKPRRENRMPTNHRGRPMLA